MLDVFALTFARADHVLGSGLRPARPECVAARTQQKRMPAVCFPNPPAPERTFQASAGMTTIADLRRILLGSVDRPVVDRTGLTGYYELLLRFDHPLSITADVGSTNVPAPVTRQDQSAAMLAAVRDQLGLKGERDRQLMEVLVIDSMAPPEPD
jgi:uncharacterized protein (TIGR03435 family)